MATMKVGLPLADFAHEFVQVFSRALARELPGRAVPARGEASDAPDQRADDGVARTGRAWLV